MPCELNRIVPGKLWMVPASPWMVGVHTGMVRDIPWMVAGGVWMAGVTIWTTSVSFRMMSASVRTSINTSGISSVGDRMRAVFQQMCRVQFGTVCEFYRTSSGILRIFSVICLAQGVNSKMNRNSFQTSRVLSPAVYTDAVTAPDILKTSHEPIITTCYHQESRINNLKSFLIFHLTFDFFLNFNKTTTIWHFTLFLASFCFLLYG